MDAEQKQVSVNNERAEAAAGFFPLDRFNAFSDGVFAIVITLLVLELPVPAEGAQVLPALVESWPEFLGYAISFAFVGGIWLSHSGLTRFMKRGDAVFSRLNLVLLLFVSLLPFSTHLMVTHINESAREAVAVYGINLFVASGMMTALLYYAARDRYLVEDDVADERLKRAYRRRLMYLILSALIIVVGLASPTIALGFYIVLTLGFIIQPLVGVWRRH
jgi:uncharacterized membrane protein